MIKDITKLFAKLRPVLNGLKRYRVTLFIVTFLGLYVFLIMRISTLVNGDPSPQAVSEQLKTVKRLNIDQAAIDRILQLEEQNIEVRSLFEQARGNPFTE